MALADKETGLLITADKRLLERVRESPWADRIMALDRYDAPT